MADGQQVFSTSEVLTASKLNKVSRRVVIDCTSATRPSSPAEGQHIYEIDTDLLRRWNGSIWVTYPNGIIAHDTVVSTAHGTGALGALSGSGLTAACVDSEWYVYEIDVVASTGTATDRMNLQPQIDTGSGYVTFDIQRSVYMHTTGEGYHCSIRAVWHATYSGYVSFRLMFGAATGTVTVTTGTDCTLSHMGNYALT